MTKNTDNLKQAIFDAVKKAYPDVGLKLEAIALEHPAVEEYGDYSCNIALKLAKQTGQKPTKLADKIITSFARGGLAKLSQNSGFINFKLSTKDLVSHMVQALVEKDRYGQSDVWKDEKVVVEYTDPNPFKELHIGHLLSNVTGEALTRLHEAMGATTWRADYFGDVGIHSAKSVWGMQEKMKTEGLTLAALTEKGLMDRVKFMGEAYVLGTKKYDEDEAIKAEIGHLNNVLYLAAQKMWTDQGTKSVIDYNQEKTVNTEEVEVVYDLYKTARKWSLDYFESIYKILGTKFNGYYPESRVGEVGYKYVLDNLGKVFEESEGAIVFKGEKFGLHTRVFINKHKLPTYEAKELGLAPTKYQDFPYTKSIIVVGTEIKEYFKVLVEALTQVNPKLGKVTEPICTGMVKVPNGKMGSRFGNVITVLGLMDQLKKLVWPKLTRDNLKEEEKDGIAEKVAVAAIKYAFLKNSIGQDVVFDLEKSLSFEGDSGPYIQYTYARAKSVLRKTQFPITNYQFSINYQFTNEEMAILRFLYRFPEVVEAAAKNYSPNLVCSYLFELAKRFNNLYNNCPILENDFRLALTEAVSIVLKNGLTMLGIAALERM